MHNVVKNDKNRQKLSHNALKMSLHRRKSFCTFVLSKKNKHSETKLHRRLRNGIGGEKKIKSEFHPNRNTKTD